MHDPISYFEALILGIIQGLTEFLPISSSAHILIVSTLAGWGDPGAAFTAVTQLGTETAVLWRGLHIVAARCFSALMLLHVVAVSLHFVDLVRD